MRGATAKEKGPPRRSRTGPVGGGNRKPTYPCAALRNGIEVTRPRPVFPRKAWRWNSGRSRGVPPSDEAMGALIAASGQAIQQKAPPERGSHLGIRRRPPEAGRSDKLCLRGTWRRTQSILFHALHSLTAHPVQLHERPCAGLRAAVQALRRVLLQRENIQHCSVPLIL